LPASMWAMMPMLRILSKGYSLGIFNDQYPISNDP
jgi:hypothetical protein